MSTEKDRLVVAAVYASDAEANIAMGMLRANGIPCVINGEIINSVLAIHLTSVDGIKLLVHERDFDEALRLLQASGDE